MKKTELNKVITLSETYPSEWRKGQSFFNALYELHPEVADKIRGTDLDPFHHDDRIPLLINYLLTKPND